MAKPQYGAAHQARRREWARILREQGALPCRCGCGELIHDGEPWDLGHGAAHAHGGDGRDSAPEIPGHNRGQGNAIATHKANNSRDWW